MDATLRLPAHVTNRCASATVTLSTKAVREMRAAGKDTFAGKPIIRCGACRKYHA